MKRLFLFTALIILVLCGIHCDMDCRAVHGAGDVVKKEIPVRDISGVKLTTFADLFIRLGDEEKLELEAQENLHEYFQAEVRQGTLILKKRPRTNLRTRKPVRFYLTVKGLESIGLSSSGSIKAPGFKAERFRVRVSSSGSLRMGNLEAGAVKIGLSSSGSAYMGDIEAGGIEVKISSSGSVKVNGGKVEKQSVRISSSGSYRASDLESEEARVRLSSSGSAYVRVSDHLEATLTSSGSVYYSGSPKVKARTTSSGRVRQR
jgi:hypothetical protein